MLIVLDKHGKADLFGALPQKMGETLADALDFQVRAEHHKVVFVKLEDVGDEVKGVVFYVDLEVYQCRETELVSVDTEDFLELADSPPGA